MNTWYFNFVVIALYFDVIKSKHLIRLTVKLFFYRINYIYIYNLLDNFVFTWQTHNSSTKKLFVNIFVNQYMIN